MIALRDYQRQAIDGIHRAWEGLARSTGTGYASRVAVVLPTGAGKTVIFAHSDLYEPVLRSRIGNRPRRMLVLVHRDELATQAVAKIRTINPTASVGRVQAKMNQTDRQIIVASVQTLARPERREQIRDVELVVVDEAHHAVAPTYVEIMRHFGCFGSVGADRSTPTVGFSATLERGEADGHLGDIWQEVVLQRDVLDGIREGWLVDVHGKRVHLEDLNLKNVKSSRGDYTANSLGEELTAADAPEHVAEAYVDLASDRQGIAFWPTVDIATTGAASFAEHGISAEVVTGTTPLDERAEIYDRYRRGDLQVLSSVMVLTEGFDMPQASCAIIARPTRSAPLYVQMAGRVLRPHHLPVPGYPVKRDALLIDVVGAASRHRLATLADLSVTTQVQVQGDESLLDAADAAMDEQQMADAVIAGEIDPTTGRRVVQDIDLFNRPSVWQCTPRGTRFIAAGDWTLFLWPDASTPGLWTIGYTETKARAGQGQVAVAGLTLDWAVQQAEELAARAARKSGRGRVDSRRASWRNGEPSEQQLRHARSLGCHVPADARKGAVSDMISMVYATRALGG